MRRYPRCGDRPPSAPITTHSLCKAAGLTVAATVTDHIVPHRGNMRLFWAESNRQSLCTRCHGIKSQAERGQSLPVVMTRRVVTLLCVVLFSAACHARHVVDPPTRIQADGGGGDQNIGGPALNTPRRHRRVRRQQMSFRRSRKLADLNRISGNASNPIRSVA